MQSSQPLGATASAAHAGHARAIVQAMTYSIVARDPETGQLGVAVQSHYFSVGPVVPWLEAGVGAVATQSLVRVAYGPDGLRHMREGAEAPGALRAALAADDATGVRQVAMVDNAGRVAAHTGSGCIPHTGHLIGDGFSVQANMMRRTTVPEAMRGAFAGSTGAFADRLLAALFAAEDEGGDIRGRQSAAVRIVRGEPTSQSWLDVVVDLRVEDHADPNRELRRLLDLHQAYQCLDRSEELRVAGRLDEAAAEAQRALEKAPDSVELGFWWGIELVKDGRDVEARPLLDRAFAVDAGWRELIQRLVTADLLADDPKLHARILGTSSP
jgi:uncharacterized Ntn-hydrolase superfamily protein